MTFMEIIHLSWQGPMPIEEAQKLNGPSDYGVYQIYGTHSVGGPNTMLYVGQASEKTFSSRMASHASDWVPWEAHTVQVHVGRVSVTSGTRPSDEEWGYIIDKAEALIIFFTAPPYNSSRIRSLRYEKPEIIVVNHLQRGRLPQIISNVGEIHHPNGGGLDVLQTGRAPSPPPGAPEDDPVEPR